MQKETQICEYGELINNGIEIRLKCINDNQNCCLIRWCVSQQCIKMTDNYYRYGCTKNKITRSDFMGKKNKLIEDDINNFVTNENLTIDEEIVQVEIEKKYKEEICKVINVKNNAYFIDFKGYGISIHVSENHLLDKSLIKDFIKIKYLSDISKPDFEFYPVYE